MDSICAVYIVYIFVLDYIYIYIVKIYIRHKIFDLYTYICSSEIFWVSSVVFRDSFSLAKTGTGFPCTGSSRTNLLLSCSRLAVCGVEICLFIEWSLVAAVIKTSETLEFALAPPKWKTILCI